MANHQSQVMERRRHARIPLFKQIRSIRLDPEPGKIIQELRTYDLSRGGMGVMSEDTLYPGQRLVLQIPRTGDRGERSIYATVVRCCKESDQYRIGLEFETNSQDAYYCASTMETVSAA